MRRAHVLAAFAAAAISAAAPAARGQGFVPPTTAEGWYTPPGGFTVEPASASWSQGKDEYVCTVTADGTVVWGDVRPNSYAAQLAIEKALRNELDIITISESIEAVAGRLAMIDWGSEKETEVEDTSSGQKASGRITRTPERFVVSAPGVLSGGGMRPDGVTIKTNANGTASLLNWNAPAADPTLCADALGDMLDGTKDSGGKHYVLTRFGEAGALHYTPVGWVPFLDSSQFDKSDGSKIVTLAGSTLPANAGKLLASTGHGICWTNREAGVRVYADRTRMPPSSSGVFALGGDVSSLGANFSPPENWAGAGLALEHAEGGASAPMRLALAGLAEAEEGTVPTADGDGGVEWKPAAAAPELRVKGTSGEFVAGTNLVFRTAEDSDVRVTATVEDGAVVLTFGVYYK